MCDVVSAVAASSGRAAREGVKDAAFVQADSSWPDDPGGGPEEQIDLAICEIKALPAG